jgi:uncharacterized protein (TIGR03086 family)
MSGWRAGGSGYHALREPRRRVSNVDNSEEKDGDVSGSDRTPDEVVELDRRAGQRMVELIAGSANLGHASTPCAGWTVEDLVTHVIAGNVKYAGIARGDDFVPGAPTVSIGADPAATYAETLAAMVEAWQQPGALEREIGLPRGVRGPAEVAAWIHLGETLGHGWDLARATDQAPWFDDDIVSACHAATKQRMPPQRGEESPFADARETDSDSLIDQLAAFLGRDVS